METTTLEIPVRPPRRFLPDDLSITGWAVLEPYFQDLENRAINSLADLEAWLLDVSEMESVLEEDLAWRYIHMSIDTTDEELKTAFELFVREIQPKVAPYDNAFDKKLVACPYLDELDQEKYRIHLRKVKKAIEIYREENIPLFTELSSESQQFGMIAGKMTVNVNGKDLTLQQAGKLLLETDRELRESVYRQIQERRMQDLDALNDLFTSLIKKRHQVAVNADFANFRDYKFASMGRFDYTVEDCYAFHDAIRAEILPIVNDYTAERKATLGVDQLRPWDGSVDVKGRPPLKPFEKGSELLDKSIQCFDRVRPYFGQALSVMRDMGHLDLESKQGKSPGGFNYPLYEIGVPFIFMNAVGTIQDVITMVHEGGHAVHSFLSRNLELTAFKNLTSEVAELASMSMELISMEHWDVFFDDEEDLKRARKSQLIRAIGGLPWIALIDRFQHWIYENPNHSVEERMATWVEMQAQYSSNVTDWEGLEQYRSMAWQRQLHLYEVPFYYIEYGMAQLGAIAMWRNYKQNPEKALDDYMAALRLGYTRSIGEIYEAAGIRFDFSREYVRELAAFVKDEMAKLG